MSRILHKPDPSTALRPWVWPLPNLHGSPPRILEDSSGQGLHHGATVLGYESHVALPAQVPVFAVRDGLIVYASNTPRGHQVCVDHVGGWGTQYDGLEVLRASATDRFRKRRKERVRAGDVLGFIGISSPYLRFRLSLYGDAAPARERLQGSLVLGPDDLRAAA